jgi:dTDP-4-amino-4,6-dideoxygalactose transaminase
MRSTVNPAPQLQSRGESSGLRVPFLDLKAQYAELAPELEAAAIDVLRSGSYVLGPNHNALELEIAELHGCKYAIGLNSGTDALRIMLDAAGVGRGDEVITTAFTFVASAETIVQAGATPVFVDIDPATYMIDPALIEAAITPKTKAIMPIHLFGQLADAETVQEIADRHGLIVLEDAAQAIAARRNGKLSGQFGLAAGFSFYVTKNLGAAGDAGMILTNDPDFAERCRSIRIHGMGRERYYYDYVGYTSRLDEIQAAILRVKLKRLESWIQMRSRLADFYLWNLAGTAGLGLPALISGNEHTYHQFTIRAQRRDDLHAYLKANAIDSMIYYPVPLHFHKPYQHYASGPGSLPLTEQVCQEVLSLPVHEHMTMDQAAFVVETIKKFYSNRFVE